MGRNSSTNKSKRLLSELSIHMRAHASGSARGIEKHLGCVPSIYFHNPDFLAIRLDYIPYMKEIILAKLVHGGESVRCLRII